jgi:cytochrome c
LVPAAPSLHGEPWQLGEVPEKAAVAAWDIDVRPDGVGLPPGRGSVRAGERVYETHCTSCHGAFGESNVFHELAGGAGTLASDQPLRTVGSFWPFAPTLFDYIYRAMPFERPKSLNADEVYAVTAYLLHLNDLLPFDAELDQQSLPRVVMPNRMGFIWEDPLPDVANSRCMANCVESTTVPAAAR